MIGLLLQTRIHPLTLAFSSDLEQDFISYYQNRSRKQIRIALLLAAAVFGLYGILDAQLDATASSFAWFVRYSVVCPALMIGFLLTFSDTVLRFMQGIVGTLIVLSAFGIILIMQHSDIYNDHYFPVIMLVIVYGLTSCQLRFVHFTVSMISILAGYELYSLTLADSSEMWNNNLQIILLVATGMFSSYQLERSTRKDFLQNRLIIEGQRSIEEIKFVKKKDLITRHLHDNIGGIISNISIISSLAVDSPDRENWERVLESISELSRECLTEIRMSIDLLGNKYETWGYLFADMRHFGRNMLEVHDVVFNFQAEGAVEAPVSVNLVAINLMGIYREALTNIVKHANATRVDILLLVEDGRLYMTIRDDGQWRETACNHAGKGLSNMTARAAEAGGTFEIDTCDGTRICVSIPLEAS